MALALNLAIEVSLNYLPNCIFLVHLSLSLHRTIFLYFTTRSINSWVSLDEKFFVHTAIVLIFKNLINNNGESYVDIHRKSTKIKKKKYNASWNLELKIFPQISLKTVFCKNIIWQIINLKMCVQGQGMAHYVHFLYKIIGPKL